MSYHEDVFAINHFFFWTTSKKIKQKNIQKFCKKSKGVVHDFQKFYYF